MHVIIALLFLSFLFLKREDMEKMNSSFFHADQYSHYF